MSLWSVFGAIENGALPGEGRVFKSVAQRHNNSTLHAVLFVPHQHAENLFLRVAAETVPGPGLFNRDADLLTEADFVCVFHGDFAQASPLRRGGDQILRQVEVAGVVHMAVEIHIAERNLEARDRLSLGAYGR